MNEKLKFSWGHIIAFLAIIFISYVTFMGATYMSGGNFVVASWTTLAVGLVFLAVFVGAQQLKATERKFKKRIIWERILVFSSPVIYVFCIIPFNHFWNVRANEEKIVSEFSKAIISSKKMFNNYELYSKNRLNSYKNSLKNSGISDYKTDNMMHCLELQLISINYWKLKEEAIAWINNSSKGASAWNVFLIGNTKQINKTIHDWNKELHNNSSHIMNYENPKKVYLFGKKNSSLNVVDSGLQKIETLFEKPEKHTAMGIVFAMLLYVALLFPYFLQDRNTKSFYYLIGKRKDATNSSFELETDETTDSNKKEDETGIIYFD